MGRNRWDGPGRVPNQPIREALEIALATTDLTLSDICHKLGWERQDVDGAARGAAETSKLKRCTGMSPTRDRNRRTGVHYETTTTTIDAQAAKDIAWAIGRDFDALYDGSWPDEKPAAHCKSCGDPMLKRHRTGHCGFCLAEAELDRVAVAA